MDFDQFSLVEKIVKDVDYIIRREETLNSFEIIPVDINLHNKSPVLLQGACLGLESWCIKHVYMTCYSELMDSFSKAKKKKTDSDRLIRLLNITLLINPDLSTLWNRRRELLSRGVVSTSKELNYSKLVLSRKPKCNDAFSYRRWILMNLIKDSSYVQDEDFQRIITDELQLCTSTVNQTANNYHSWCHRIWVIQQLASSPHAPSSYIHHIYCAEYAFSEQWVVTHVSDHSCFQYRQWCIQNIFKLPWEHWKDFEMFTSANIRRNLSKIFKENSDEEVSETDLNNMSEENLTYLLLGKSMISCQCQLSFSSICHRIEVLLYELSLNDELIRFYKNHETLWYHRRYIVHELFSLIYGYHGVSRKNAKIVKKSCNNCQVDVAENKAKIVRYNSDCVLTSLLFKVVIEFDKKMITERKLDGDNYADRHEKYLKFIEDVDI